MNSRSSTMFFSLGLAFLVTSLMIPIVLTAPNLSSACMTLSHCMRPWYNNTFKWYHLTSRPSTEAEWNATWTPICDNLTARWEACCIWNCSLNSLAIINMKIDEMFCSTNGREFFRRIYVDNNACVGNVDKVNRIKNEWVQCFQEAYPGKYNHTCAVLNKDRTCAAEAGGNNCGDYYKWMMDQRIAIYNEETGNSCTHDPSLVPFPTTNQ